MKTIVKHVGSVREWEGSMMSWHRHCDLIPKWCDGVNIDSEYDDGWGKCRYPMFSEEQKYRIRQREPSIGEVWTHPEDGACLFYIDTLRNHGYMIELGVQTVTVNVDDKDGFEGFVYTAPSIETYYARKFLDESRVDLGSNAGIGDLLRLVHKSAQLEK